MESEEQNKETVIHQVTLNIDLPKFDGSCQDIEEHFQKQDVKIFFLWIEECSSNYYCSQGQRTIGCSVKETVHENFYL